MIIKLLLTLMMVLIGGYAAGCTMTPESMHKPLPSMISDSKGIYLVEAIGLNEDEYTFDVLTVFKGGYIEKYGVSGGKEEISRNEYLPYNRHMTLGFWKNYVGNEALSSDCKLIKNFSKGKVYLIFDGLEVRRSWEQITYIDDYWFLSIMNLVKGKPSPKASLDKFIEATDSIVLARCDPDRKVNSRGVVLLENLWGSGGQFMPVPTSDIVDCRSENEFLYIYWSDLRVPLILQVVDGNVQIQKNSILYDLLGITHFSLKTIRKE
jgi:hypothetical protein